MIVSRVCPCGCGKQFEPSREWQTFLSPEHKKLYERRGRALARMIPRLESLAAELKSILQEVDDQILFAKAERPSRKGRGKLTTAKNLGEI